MQNNVVVSTNKIILMAVSVCAVIIGLLFFFHISHKTAQPLADENSLVFPVAREIKSFELTSSNGAKLTETVFRQHWTLLFFGFTHCSSICPTTLDLLNRVYSKLHASHPNLQVVFISLDPIRDTSAALAQYTRSFNPNFISATGNMQELRKLQSQLGVYSANMEGSDQIQHTPSIFLINPEGKWNGMFNQGMTPDQFVATFENAIKLISQQAAYG